VVAVHLAFLRWRRLAVDARCTAVSADPCHQSTPFGVRQPKALGHARSRGRRFSSLSYPRAASCCLLSQLERAVTSRSRGEVGCVLEHPGYHKPLKLW
jgi:hypothetical protein